MMLRALPAAGLVLAMAACGNGVSEGTVIDKRSEPERVYTEMVTDWATVPRTRTVCSPTGSKGQQTCRTVTTYDRVVVGSHPEQRVDDPDFYLTLDDGEKTGEIEVEQQEYERAETGQWWKRQ